MKGKIISSIKQFIIIFIILYVSHIISALLQGLLLSLGGNFKYLGANEIYFDPLITIAYLISFYFITLFFQPNYKAQFYLFLFTLFLSFTTKFSQGVIYLVILYTLLKKFNKI